MDQLNANDSVLLLEDGTEFQGRAFGKRRTGFGEVIFNTAMAGYQEVLTDPSYTEQLVVMTYPHQGNYGLNAEDNESVGGPKVAGFIVHEHSQIPSNHTSQMSLPDYLEKFGVPGLSGVDTRLLTLHLRSKGAMRGLILSLEERKKLGTDLPKIFARYPSFLGRDLMKEVTTKAPFWFSAKGGKTIVAVDFGVKLNLLRELANRDTKVVVVPATSTYDEIMAYNPDGIFLSNGPGDPAEATYAIATVKQLLGKKPVFGVCMGHQILGLALGGKTFKMKFGHRGVNQPVLHVQGKNVEISSHNHGFAVDPDSLPSGVTVSHRNLNDGTCEGLECTGKNAFSVQYHPESAPGPHDSSYLFDQFVSRL